jgi:hypothetical protein
MISLILNTISKIIEIIHDKNLNAISYKMLATSHSGASPVFFRLQSSDPISKKIQLGEVVEINGEATINLGRVYICYFGNYALINLKNLALEISDPATVRLVQ